MHRKRRQLAVVVVAVLTAAAGIGAYAVVTESPSPRTDGARGPAIDPVDGLRPIHDAGITGEGVRVGVLDASGFDTDHAALSGRIAAARSFVPNTAIDAVRDDAHGTAVASLVGRVAPDADLYLASFDDASGYRRGIDWLLAQDVDVIVAPVSFYGKRGDGSTRVSLAATRAVRRDVVFVASAGNLATGYWHGPYRDVRNGRLQFEGGPFNRLRGGRTVTLWLSWERAHREESYTLELYRETEDGRERVATSRPYRGDAVPNERIVTELAPNERYSVAVRGPANATATRLSISSPTHSLQFSRPRSSITAPATARGVLAVGAWDRQAAAVEPYSGRGPTTDGRPGIDVVAPDQLEAAGEPEGLLGSSAAGPYVGGVAALLRQVDPDSSPEEVERLLERTAVDVSPDGPDPRSGHGYVRPATAVANARNATE
ncbi:S8 family serine peptidase [Halorientalis brevis]|uniref:S8 family serine peptidase n=1 Tax=Halorientalis brevis TaxID=1126241 RepID=A0ABD6CFA3_9EURY|nr:S8 family serine peptidase [Halorientalis brevis]